MIICNSEQGTPEWFQDRAGAITASNFCEVRKRLKSGPNKGGLTTAAKEYAFKLAVERIGKTTLDSEGFRPWQADRGNRLEEDCRVRHEADIGEFVDLAGFVTTDCGRYGCSADSFVGDDGGGEYKCFLAPQKLQSIIIRDDWGDIMDQVQGCMMITGRDWWDMCLYCPPLAPVKKDFIRKRTNRDEGYIAELERDLFLFDALVEEYRGQIVGADHDAQEEQPQDFVINF
ncbi:MAG: hypothetical protein QNK32_01990 [Porticoccus sp.]|nr:hypothetical protein [Porticoccus sp.]